MTDCVFCKIVKGELDSAKIWENEEFVAMLDINPNMTGMTLVITKQHYSSYVFELPPGVYARFMHAARTVAQLLDKKLNVQRTALVMEGLGVNHAHLKLYPLPSLQKKFQETWSQEKVFFDTYPGYLSTQLGSPADMKELQKLAQKIRRESTRP